MKQELRHDSGTRGKTLNVHFVLHEDFEVPGAYWDWARSRGHRTASTKVYESEALPENADGIDFLIVMGGPQSPDEDRQAFPYYDPEAELRLMRQAVAADKYIVGVCLGAQLLSVTYGARHGRSPHREIGVYPVELTQEGLNDPHTALLGASFLAGHWHGDMPGLTDGRQYWRRAKAVRARLSASHPSIMRFRRIWNSTAPPSAS